MTPQKFSLALRKFKTSRNIKSTLGFPNLPSSEFSDGQQRFMSS